MMQDVAKDYGIVLRKRHGLRITLHEAHARRIAGSPYGARDENGAVLDARNRAPRIFCCHIMRKEAVSATYVEDGAVRYGRLDLFERQYCEAQLYEEAGRQGQYTVQSG